jgi:parvulin-like peptidyl-prolyl isomerase
MRINKGIKYFLFALTALCVSTASVPVFAGVVDKVIVVVNDEVVTQREFDRQFSFVEERYKERYNGKELEEQLEKARKAFLEQMIDSKVAVSIAKKKKVEIDENELADRIRKIRSYYGSEEEFLKALNEKGTNLTEFERGIREQMLAQKVVEEEITPKIVITPADVRELYEQNKENIVSPRRVKTRAIMIRKTDNARDDKKRLGNAQLALNNNRDFAEVAKKLSEGPYASKGGEIGYIAPGQMLQEIDQTVFSLKKGEVSEVVETNVGYHIFRVEDIEEPKQLELAEVSDFLRNELYKKRFAEELVEWLKEKRKNAYISYK